MKKLLFNNKVRYCVSKNDILNNIYVNLHTHWDYPEEKFCYNDSRLKEIPWIYKNNDGGYSTSYCRLIVNQV